MAETQKRGMNGKVGTVMVVGAGIAGVQAAMDLADSGFKVHLIEKNPSIGGAMVQLDKTFPTNDCSMCIVSPKLVEASRHNNIELHTYSEVEQISGSAGNFTVTLKQKARSVDPDKCTGCGACMAACPVRQVVRVQDVYEYETTKETKILDEMIDHVGCDRANLIHILQEANYTFGYLSEAVLRRISIRLQLSFSEVFGTASFYKAFSLTPRGKHIINVCMGTACHVRGASRIVEEMENLLEIESGATTEDGLFTLEEVNCLGACALGPVMTIDGDYHGHLVPAKLESILKLYREAV